MIQQYTLLILIFRFTAAFALGLKFFFAIRFIGTRNHKSCRRPANYCAIVWRTDEYVSRRQTSFLSLNEIVLFALVEKWNQQDLIECWILCHGINFYYDQLDVRPACEHFTMIFFHWTSKFNVFRGDVYRFASNYSWNRDALKRSHKRPH